MMFDENYIYSGIYYILNKINNKIYIGSSKNIRSRFYVHLNCLRKNKHANEYLQNSYNKNGYNNFKFGVLIKCSEEDLIYWENFFIKLFNSASREYGYNIDPSPERLFRSNETIEKFKKTIRKKYDNGYVPYFKGKKHSEESKKLIGIKSAQKEFSKEFMNNLLKASNEACYKPILQIDVEGRIVREYKGINIAARELNISRHNIGNVCRKKQKTAGGFIWKFKNESIQSTN